jgi:o-succinylbenzoate synthase
MIAARLAPYRLKFARPARTSRGDLTARAILFIQLWHRDQPEKSGWGECGPLPRLSRDDLPDFRERAAQVCHAINAGAGLDTLPIADLPSVAFGLETALRDLNGGGLQRLWNTDFSRSESGISTHGLIWMGTAAEVLRQVEDKLAAGFTVIKLKVGALAFEEEIALLRNIRSAYAGAKVTLRLDANGAFTPADALQKLELLAPLGIEFLEQPIAPGQWAHMSRICRDSPIPIALDEDLIPIKDSDERRRLLEFVRPQHVILKPLLLGGFTTCEGWIDDAEQFGAQWWVNSLLESNIGLNAIAQWTSMLDMRRVHGLGTGKLFTNNVQSPLALVGSHLVLDSKGSWQLPPAGVAAGTA